MALDALSSSPERELKTHALDSVLPGPVGVDLLPTVGAFPPSGPQACTKQQPHDCAHLSEENTEATGKGKAMPQGMG